VKALGIIILVVALSAGCSGSSQAPGAVAVPLPPIPKKRIADIDKMGFEKLSRWVRVCAPYNASLEGRANNPYEPTDCDEVQYRHDSWRIPQTQKPAAYLPGLH
jgi:hypothetical protein